MCRSVVTNCFDSKMTFDDFLFLCIIFTLFLERAMRLHMLEQLRRSTAPSHFCSQRIPSHFPSGGCSAIILLVDCACIIRTCKINSRVYQYKWLTTHTFGMDPFRQSSHLEIIQLNQIIRPVNPLPAPVTCDKRQQANKEQTI